MGYYIMQGLDTVFPQIQPRSRIEPGSTYPTKLKSHFEFRFEPR